MYSYTPYIWPYMGTIFVNVFMLMYMLKYRKAKGAVPFMFTLLFCCTWCIGTMMEYSADNLSVKLFWAKLNFPSYTLGPLAWIVMVLQLTDNWNKWAKPRRLILFCIVPFITILTAWIGDPAHIIWKSVSVYKYGSLHPLIINHGVWFWVHSIYSDSLNLISLIVIIWYWKVNAPLYKKQLKYLFYSMTFVMFINLLFIFKIYFKYDATPVAWGISSIFVFRALFLERLFDLVPIARNRVMESMGDFIVVLDLKNRVEDINPSAENAFKLELDKNIGCSAELLFDGWTELMEMIENGKAYIEFERTEKGQVKYYEAHGFPIKNDRQVLLGKLLIIRDVTEKVLMTQEILLKQQEISAREEREKLARDLHDNFGQILGFVNVQTQAIMEYLKRGQQETALKLLESLRDVTQQSQKDVRQTIVSMIEERVSNENSEVDFIEQLNRQIRSIEKNFNIKFRIDYKLINSHMLLDSKIWNQVENIIKEALNNIIKHSKATDVNILFEELENELNITVKDNGCGFELSRAKDKSQNGLGLVFMQERAEEFNGYVEINSAMGAGTAVKVSIPIK